MTLSGNRILELLELELQTLKGEGVRTMPVPSADVRSMVAALFPGCGNLPAHGKSTKHGTANQRSRDPEKIILPEGTKAVQWEWLKSKVLNCEECKKHVHPGKKAVFGVGNVDSDIFFCGEAPGADEETIGEPFVGRAGQLLTKIISAMGLERGDVYIANIMNWRPEMPTEVGNRPPTQEEMEFCLPFLLGQIEIVRPKVIVALGATAVSGLIGHDPSRRMRDVRGKWTTFAGIPLMVTFHPSYLLRNSTNSAKRTVWEDMLAVMERLGMQINERQRKYFL
ncbi:MAG: uracil-DNA glycosylase [Puniceicoccales bacterium]|nr:uracil-DNA glycosylase [Puniceicoccales bacterium]